MIPLTKEASVDSFEVNEPEPAILAVLLLAGPPPVRERLAS